MAGPFETIDLLLDRRSTSEASLSSQLLYKFLYNNLRVGQWELARACIETLLQQDGNYGETFAELLRNVVEEPLLYRYAWYLKVFAIAVGCIDGIKSVGF
jgi:hypothetical protein